jgi:dCMP deaminase
MQFAMKDIYRDAFMDMTIRFGKTSHATRAKVGAILVKNGSCIALGVNGQPPGWHTEVCEGDDGLTLPTVRHAEDACLQKLWNSTETAQGSTMFVSMCPCLPCSVKIATAGVKKVYFRQQYRDNSGIDYLRSKGVDVEQI